MFIFVYNLYIFSLNCVLSKTILKEIVSKYIVNVDLLRILGFKFPWFLKKSNICSILHTFMYAILLLIFILLYTYVFLHKPVIAAHYLQQEW